LSVAQAHLGRDWYGRRHGATHGRDDAAHQFRLVEQHGAAPVLVHRLGRAAEVQVDAGRASGVASTAALSATQAGSEPSSWGRTGTPAGVRLPWRSSGTMRVKTRVGQAAGP
jgi:hypothetical protein